MNNIRKIIIFEGVLVGIFLISFFSFHSYIDGKYEHSLTSLVEERVDLPENALVSHPFEYRTIRWKWDSSELEVHDHIHNRIQIKLLLQQRGHVDIEQVPAIVEQNVGDPEIIFLSQNMKNVSRLSYKEEYKATNRGESLATSYKSIKYSYHHDFPESTWIRIKWVIKLHDLPQEHVSLRGVWELSSAIYDILKNMLFGNLIIPAIVGLVIGIYWSRSAYIEGKDLQELNIKFFVPIIVIVIISHLIIKTLESFVFIPS